MNAARLQSGGVSNSPLRDAAAWEASSSPDLATGKPLISSGMDGREDIRPITLVCEVGPEKMTCGTDNTGVGQQHPAGRTTMQAHLLFDHYAKVLRDMEPICGLCSPRCALTGSLRVEAAMIPADRRHLGMVLMPVGADDHIPIPEGIWNQSPLQIDAGRPVSLGFSSFPVITAEDTHAGS